MSSHSTEVVRAVIDLLVQEAGEELQTRGDKAAELVLDRLGPNIVIANKARRGEQISEDDLATLHPSVGQNVRELLK